MAKLEVRKASAKNREWVTLGECQQNDVVMDRSGDIYLVTDQGPDDPDAEEIKVVQIGGSPDEAAMIFDFAREMEVRHLKNPQFTYDD